MLKKNMNYKKMLSICKSIDNEYVIHYEKDCMDEYTNEQYTQLVIGRFIDCMRYYKCNKYYKCLCLDNYTLFDNIVILVNFFNNPILFPIRIVLSDKYSVTEYGHLICIEILILQYIGAYFYPVPHKNIILVSKYNFLSRL